MKTPRLVWFVPRDVSCLGGLKGHWTGGLWLVGGTFAMGWGVFCYRWWRNRSSLPALESDNNWTAIVGILHSVWWKCQAPVGQGRPDSLPQQPSISLSFCLSASPLWNHLVSLEGKSLGNAFLLREFNYLHLIPTQNNLSFPQIGILLDPDCLVREVGIICSWSRGSKRSLRERAVNMFIMLEFKASFVSPIH